MWWIIIIIIAIYLIGVILAWGTYISHIRRICPNGVFIASYNKKKNINFYKQSYDAAIVRALTSWYSVWYSYQYEQGFYYGLKWR